MPKFILNIDPARDDFNALDAFTQGYIEALFFTEEGPDNLGDAGFVDMSPDALEKCKNDCKAFLDGLPRDGQGRTYIDLANDYAPQGYNDTQAGHDFWFTRNHHGVGFWDRGLGEIGKRLTAHADTFGEVWPYIGDDGKVYID